MRRDGRCQRKKLAWTECHKQEEEWGVGSPGRRAEPGACCQQAAIKGRLGMAGESEEFERSLQGNTVRWEQDGQGASEAAWSLSQEVRVYRNCHLQNFVTFISGREFK